MGNAGGIVSRCRRYQFAITGGIKRGKYSTLIASQLEPDQWYLRINSELCADSILNRVVEHARFLDIKGPNMREYTARLRAGKDEDYWK